MYVFAFAGIEFKLNNHVCYFSVQYAALPGVPQWASSHIRSDPRGRTETVPLRRGELGYRRENGVPGLGQGDRHR